jgi:4-hydroxy-tetrahydrodipicolinate reductase
MTDMKLVVAGASGRMGRMLTRAVCETPGVTLHAALEREGAAAVGQDAGLLAGVGELGVTITSDPLDALVHADGQLDFTAPAATLAYAELAAQARLVHVVGTTGLSKDDLRKIDAAGRHTVVVRSGNMSLGVNLLAALVRRAAAALGEEFDIEVLEMHHRNKVDAPSGTALLLGQAAAQGRGVDLDARSVRARDGHTGARKAGDIGFATLRGGSVIGEHAVIFAAEGERIEFVHKADDRGLFAKGAVRAALWGRGRKPGVYAMTDVLGLD